MLWFVPQQFYHIEYFCQRRSDFDEIHKRLFYKFKISWIFEAWVKTEHPALEPYLLAMFNGEDLDRVIYQHAFKERLAQEK